MKLLIVDDEPLVRVGIKSSFDWEGHGFDLAGEADDGEKALAMIEKIKPDLVFLDIKMPKKDGLQVLKEIQEKGLHTYVVVLSSFDDLEHVKMAMKLGAKDYFHKPAMNGSMIADALKQFREEQFKGSGKSTATKTGENTLKALLNGEDVNHGHLAVKERNLSVLVMKVKNHAEVMSRYQGDDSDFFKKSFVNIMKEVVSKEKEAELFSVSDAEHGLLISQSSSQSAQEVHEKITKLTDFIVQSFKRLMNIELIIGVSDQIHSFKEIPQAYQKAQQASQHSFFEDGKSIFHYEQTDGQKKEACLSEAADYISRLKSSLNDGDRHHFLQLLPEWNDFIKGTHCLSEQDVKKIYKGFLFILMDEEEAYFQAEKQVDELETFGQLAAFFAEKVGEEQRQLSPITKNILTYLNENYEKDISLKQLAEEFYVSPNYISKLFNKEMERGLLDYVNEIRVNKAKVLLLDYQYKIYEVAEMVGFNSQVHFNIVFNKYMGMSPNEYRKKSL